MADDFTVSARSDLEAWREDAGRNRFDRDSFLQRVLRRYPGSRQAEFASRLGTVAAETGPEFAQLVQESNRDENLPTLRRHDADGRPIEEVNFHPAYHEVGRRFWSSGVLSGMAQAGSGVTCGATVYLLAQHGEAGHGCPVACTAGAIKLLQELGTSDQRERYLPSLLDPDYDRRLHAAQFVTEVQGGSDVGRNACRAVPEPGRPGWYRLSGEKWFCSVADAGLFVVSARIDGALSGTKGLGLFLVPRMLEGAPNGFALRRLKSKLGTRSMPTGEIDFDRALGEAIGPTEDGFRNLIGIVLDTSRVHNALAACGLMRRAFVEARSYARHRVAFDNPIVDFPAVREILARMRLRTMAAVSTTFRVLEMTDRIEGGAGDDTLGAARRIAVMINKYWTSLAGTSCVREGIEILGGNGTIEEFSVLPRLYRDSIVFESWEGTHNTLCAQVLRDFATRGLHEPWLRRLEAEIESVNRDELNEQKMRALNLHRDATARIGALLAGDAETAAARIRHVVDRMCRLTDWVSLLTQAQSDLEQDGQTDLIDGLELYRWAEPGNADPTESLEIVEIIRRFMNDAG